MCPFGDEESTLADDRPVFIIVTPIGTNPDDVLPDNSIDVVPGDQIIITVANEPIDFVLMDLRFVTDRPTRVTLEKNDGSPDDEDEVSMKCHYRCDGDLQD